LARRSLEKIYINSYTNLYNSVGYVTSSAPKFVYPALTKPVLFRFEGDSFDVNETDSIIALINSMEVDQSYELTPIIDVHIDLIRSKLNSYFGRTSFGRYNGYKLKTKTMKDRENKYIIIKVVDMLPER